MFKGFGEFRRRILEERAREEAARKRREAFWAAYNARKLQTTGHLFDFENSLGGESPAAGFYHLLNEIAFLRARVDKLEGQK